MFYIWKQPRAAWARTSRTDNQPNLRAKKPRLVSLLIKEDQCYILRFRLKKSRWRFQKWRQIENQKGKPSKLQALICNQVLFKLHCMWAAIYSMLRRAWQSSGVFKKMFNDIPWGSASKIIYVEAPHKLKHHQMCCYLFLNSYWMLIMCLLLHWLVAGGVIYIYFL